MYIHELFSDDTTVIYEIIYSTDKQTDTQTWGKTLLLCFHQPAINILVEHIKSSSSLSDSNISFDNKPLKRYNRTPQTCCCLSYLCCWETRDKRNINRIKKGQRAKLKPKTRRGDRTEGQTERCWQTDERDPWKMTEAAKKTVSHCQEK